MSDIYFKNYKKRDDTGEIPITQSEKDFQDRRNQQKYDEIIKIPKTDELLQQLLTIIPLQLIAYEVAKLKNCDIDKPRNLAKSVTVE